MKIWRNKFGNLYKVVIILLQQNYYKLLQQIKYCCNKLKLLSANKKSFTK